MNRINKQMVDSTLTEKEVEKIAEETAKALGSKFSVTKGSVDNRSFSLDYDGVKYDGGSYLIMYNGDIVNVAIMKAPIYYNYKTKKKYEFGGDFQSGVYAGGGKFASKDYDVIVKLPNGLTTKKGFEGFSKEEVIEWCEIRGWKYNSKGEKEGGYILKDYEFFVKRPRLVSVSLPNSKRKMATGGGVGAYYIVTFGFNGDEGYQVVNSKPIFAKSENEAELMLKDQFESYEGVSCEIISTKKQLATGGGVGLIGNQKRIDMNKNGKIDAEDFKILRSTMNGAWRNERKHVNHSEDYEVRYAKPRPSRTGYKGKRSFDDGGSIDAFTIRMVRGTSGKPTEVISDPREVKFANGGGFENKDTWQNLLEEFGFKKGRRKYGLDMYYKRGYIASVDKELRNVNLMFEDDVIYKGYSVQGLMNELENQFGKRKFEDGGGFKMKYYVIDSKDGKILSKGFNTEEEAKVEKFKIFEKTNNFFLSQKKMLNGGEFMTDSTFGNFQNNVYATGGGVEYVPVSQKISKKEKDEFLEYIDGFYGKKGIYADDLKGGFSKVELRKAMNTYLKQLGSAPTWGYGDSFDRESVRQILQPSYKMFNEGGFMSRLLTRKKDQPKVETINEDIDLKDDSRIRVKSSSFVRKDKEGDWMMKNNSSKEARAYAGGGSIERKYNSMSKEAKEELMQEKIGVGRTPFNQYEKYNQLSDYHKKLVDKYFSGKLNYAGGGKTETPAKKGKGNHKMKATTDLARKIRKDGEKWTDAIKRASQQLK